MNYVRFGLLNFLYYRCIKTYEIEFSSVASGKFRRINPQDTIFLSFQYSVPTGKYAHVVLQRKMVTAFSFHSYHSVLLREGDVFSVMDQAENS